MQKVTVLSELSVGIDLHKTQFTVCAISSDGELLLEKQYETKKEGYSTFLKLCIVLRMKENVLLL